MTNMRFPMRLFLTTILLIVGVKALAQAPGPWDRLVTLRVENESLSDAFLKLFVDARVAYKLTEQAERLISGTKVTTNLERIPLRNAVESLVRSAGRSNGRRLNPRFEKDRCVIDVLEAQPASPHKGPLADRSPDAHLINYNAHDVTVLHAVTEVLDRVKTGCRIQPALRAAMAAKTVSAKYNDIPLSAAIWALMKDLPLKDQSVMRWFEQERGYYVFLLAPQTEGHKPTSARVSLKAKDELIGLAFQSLFDSADLSYAFPQQLLGAAVISASFTDALLEEKISAMLKLSELQDKVELREAGGIYMLQPKWPMAGQAPVEPRITARFKNADIRYALKAVFAAAGHDYTLDPTVVGTVSVEFINLPLKEALEKVAKNHAGPLSLSYRLDDRVYRVTTNKDYENWK